MFFGKEISKTVVAAILLLCFSCNKDDDPTTSIVTQPMTATFEDLNTCSFPDDTVGTFFTFSVPYSADPDITISKVQYEFIFPDGTEGTQDAVDFNATGSILTYATCFLFGETEYVDISTVLIDNNGESSNESKLRLQKPEGAN